MDVVVVVVVHHGSWELERGAEESEMQHDDESRSLGKQLSRTLPFAMQSSESSG